ncbi:MAG: response regulator [Actinomycetota bacterium]
MVAAPDDALRQFRHDVRSPLNVVLGFAVMLEEDLDGDDAESARHIRVAAEQILGLVEALPGEAAPAATVGASRPNRAAPVDGDVVLIEDNASNVRLVERILAHRPTVTLTSLTDVDEVRGWLAASTAAPAVVLLDRHLGRADGLDLVGEIRSVHDDVPIVVVTADATDLARDEARSAGADAVVTKPFSVAELLDVVDQSSSATGSKR